MESKIWSNQYPIGFDVKTQSDIFVASDSAVWLSKFGNVGFCEYRWKKSRCFFEGYFTWREGFLDDGERIFFENH